MSVTSATSQRLRNAIDNIAKEAAGYAVNVPPKATSVIYTYVDTIGTKTANRLMPYLEKLAHDRWHYAVENTMLPMGVMGSTPAGIPGSPRTIELAAVASSPRRFYALAHEDTHLILGHVPMTLDEFKESNARRQIAMVLRGAPDNVHEELSCELAAGAVCRLTGIGDPDYQSIGVSGYMRGYGIHTINEKDRADGLRGAETLWEAIAPGLQT